MVPPIFVDYMDSGVDSSRLARDYMDYMDYMDSYHTDS